METVGQSCQPCLREGGREEEREEVIEGEDGRVVSVYCENTTATCITPVLLCEDTLHMQWDV